MRITSARISYLALAALTAVFVAACDADTGERETYPRLPVKDARPIWLDALRSALDSRLDVYGEYVILGEPFLGKIALVKKENVIIQCDPLLGVEIIGSLAGGDMPAVSLGLIGTVAEFDDSGYSIPDIVQDEDDPDVLNLMKELCIEVANALDGK